MPLAGVALASAYLINSSREVMGRDFSSSGSSVGMGRDRLLNSSCVTLWSDRVTNGGPGTDPCSRPHPR